MGEAGFWINEAEGSISGLLTACMGHVLEKKMSRQLFFFFTVHS